MNYAAFRQKIHISREDICLNIYAQNREKFRIKKEKTVVKNLGKIFTAALKISNEKGFQAMSMRNFSKETGLSIGALYSYFSSKDELLEMIQRQGRLMVKRLLDDHILALEDPLDRLRKAICIHIYLSEALQPWFYFSYMEAKNMNRAEKEKALASELATDLIFADIIRQGQSSGTFLPRDPQLTAGLIKAILQDWYLKRWKHAKRKISVDQYARFVLECVEAMILPCSNRNQDRG
ncbi:MAG: TetR/AcrR family transcriptional regulator [Deltaproteobacteria bacterium]|nr:TetR/AcrR family transcriptional regulator [Deltaproteobacteria bacterium]MBW2593421.1 TetR/AcrR family transcriptional regulator [Deltaproteobacteria bacterium]